MTKQELEAIESELKETISDLPNNKQALKLLRDLADHQNGAPLARYEKQYNKLMTEVWNFLEEEEGWPKKN